MILYYYTRQSSIGNKTQTDSTYCKIWIRIFGAGFGSLFGAAFEQAASKSGAAVSLDFVDSSIISLPASQRAQFLDALTALLA